MIYYDRKGYENLRDTVFKLEDLWKKMPLKEFNKVLDKWANKKLFKKKSSLWQPKFIIN